MIHKNKIIGIGLNIFYSSEGILFAEVNGEFQLLPP